MVRLLKRLVFICIILIVTPVIFFAITFFIVTSEPAPPNTSATLVTDVTQLNQIKVDAAIQPTSIEEISVLIKSHDGPISIGGARHSMGGQIATEKALHLDMRKYNKILLLDTLKKEIRVQTGITWRQIQEVIDRHNLSVQIMQTYANFTVGGSLSVNVHGRYIGHGPIIHSVKSISIILADGSLVEASPRQNADIFYGCIGGYGGLGVIVEATLQLTDNCKVERIDQHMTVDDYPNYFKTQIRNNESIIFHNADIYPNDYTDIHAVSYQKTEKPLTITDRLNPIDSNYKVERFAIWLVSEFPRGKWLRQHVGDPLFFSSDQVKWRNYEAGHDAAELEPTSRKNSTYVLQEYFVPIDRFQSFVPTMAAILNQHHVNMVNVSVRHAKKDSLSVLSWARSEVFCFVLYYKQGTSESEQQEVGVWTRKLIDAAISEKGSYYLPYQLHATKNQFERCYNRIGDFIQLKKRLDPTNKFRNKFWDKYNPSANLK
ncbi:MAG: FAD-binding oxidoreductase [Cyclobacteriaceae bacterium]|nr:FAD-binding oxidoreductase [Cyclobacteriaceae bacterium]